MLTRLCWLGCLLATVLWVPKALAQGCPPQWTETFPSGYVNGSGFALAVFDEDGPGPLQPCLFKGGSFTSASGDNISFIARWNGRRWSAVGSGVNARVQALAVHDEDGPGPGLPALYAGGAFTTAGGVSANRIAKWDGVAWSPVGAGFNDTVYAVASWDSDGSGPLPPTLFAGGQFTESGTSVRSRIARWNGSAWSGVGFTQGMNDTVLALSVVDLDGPGPAPALLYAGGRFTTAGAVSVNGIAGWNGSVWSALGLGVGGNVLAITAFDQDAGGSSLPVLVAAGDFTTAGGLLRSRIASWNGTAWSSMGAGLDGPVYSLSTFTPAGAPAPILLAGGRFARSGSLMTGLVAQWNGTGWSAPGEQIGGSSGTETPTVYAMTPFAAAGAGSELYISGAITLAGELSTPSNAKWNGTEWTALGSGVVSRVLTLADFDADGPGPNPPQLMVGGDFYVAGGRSARAIAAWGGTAWTYRGVLANSPQSQYFAADFAVHDDGTGPALYMGGYFTSIDGLPLRNIARWNGTAWSPVGTGVDGSVLALEVYDEDGGGPGRPALYATGGFSEAGGSPATGIARWDGAAWTAVGSGLAMAAGHALATYDDDGPGPHPSMLYVGGSFGAAGGVLARNIARWNGTAWSALGAGVNNTCSALVAYDDDGPGPNNPLLFVGGSFFLAGPVLADHLATWNGSAWAQAWSDTNGLIVNTLVVLDEDGHGPGRGLLLVGGDFTMAGTVPANRIARWDGNVWSALGSGISSGSVAAIAALDEDGPGGLPPALYAGGLFLFAGGVSSSSIARWGCATCYANCDGSTSAPVLNVNDFICFQAAFAGGSTRADCDGSILLNVNDFVCFQQRFAAGCR